MYNFVIVTDGGTSANTIDSSREGVANSLSDEHNL